MLKQARFAFEFCAVESCGKCTPCRIGATRGVETVRQDPRRHRASDKNLELVSDLCNTMKFGSLCALGGFTPYPVMSALTHFPEDFRKNPYPSCKLRSEIMRLIQETDFGTPASRSEKTVHADH
jgi:formate dehydrogenase iron-sulfur subunit